MRGRLIRFRGVSHRGKKLIGFGLSRKNCELLLAHKPIQFDGAEFGLPDIDFIITGGETEESIWKEITETVLIMKKN